MGYVVDWKLTAPESFNPSNDSEVQEKIEELQNLGYDVDVTGKNGWAIAVMADEIVRLKSRLDEN